jgi:threonylcarbamoyladenosine tRNA methylthiotransferase MtaB
VLTGVHIGHYGRDLPRATTLSGLVARLLDEVPDVRFRLGSIEATEVDERLLDLLATSGDRLAPHLHMPLQSGADPVLRRMRRWHTRDQYRRRALEIAERLPVLGLGADIITGFPGETDEDHEDTRALVDELPFTYLHVFPFSPRPGTPAHGFKDQVPAQVSKARAARLRRLGRAKQRDFLKTFLDRTVEVLVTGPSGPSNGILEGLSANYAKIRFPGHSRLRNQFLEVKVRELDAEGRLRGEIVSKVSSQNDCETGFCGS